MSNDGLLLGAAIIGGGYLAINSLSGEDGAGGGSAAGGVVNIIEDAAAAAQGITEIIKNSSDSFYRFYEVVDDGKGLIDGIKDAIDDTTSALTNDGHGYNLPNDVLNPDKLSEIAENAGVGVGGIFGSFAAGLPEGAASGFINVAAEIAEKITGIDYGVTMDNSISTLFNQAIPGANANVKDTIAGGKDALVGGVVKFATHDFIKEYATPQPQSSGGSSGNSTLFTPRVVNIPKVSTPTPAPTFNIGAISVTNVRANLANYTSPAAVTTPKTSIIDSVRSWFN